MGWLDPTHLMTVLLAVAVIAAIGGFIAPVVAAGKKRNARGLLLAGFVCGFVAGAVLRQRRHRLVALRAVVRRVDLRLPGSERRRPATSGIRRQLQRVGR